MLAERVKDWERDWKRRGMQEGIEQGIQEGLEQGIEQGIEQGERKVLIRLLHRRFGPLDIEVQARLEQASTEEVERWADNIFDAQTLDDVFKLV